MTKLLSQRYPKVLHILTVVTKTENRNTDEASRMPSIILPSDTILRREICMNLR